MNRMRWVWLVSWTCMQWGVAQGEVRKIADGQVVFDISSPSYRNLGVQNGLGELRNFSLYELDQGSYLEFCQDPTQRPVKFREVENLMFYITQPLNCGGKFGKRIDMEYPKYWCKEELHMAMLMYTRSYPAIFTNIRPKLETLITVWGTLNHCVYLDVNAPLQTFEDGTVVTVNLDHFVRDALDQPLVQTYFAKVVPLGCLGLGFRALFVLLKRIIRKTHSLPHSMALALNTIVLVTYAFLAFGNGLHFLSDKVSNMVHIALIHDFVGARVAAGYCFMALLEGLDPNQYNKKRPTYRKLLMAAVCMLISDAAPIIAAQLLYDYFLVTLISVASTLIPAGGMAIYFSVKLVKTSSILKDTAKQVQNEPLSAAIQAYGKRLILTFFVTGLVLSILATYISISFVTNYSYSNPDRFISAWVVISICLFVYSAAVTEMCNFQPKQSTYQQKTRKVFSADSNAASVSATSATRKA